MRYFISTLFITATLGALAGCGQTGPLYMPPEQTPQAQPAAPAGTTEQPGNAS